MPTDPRPHDWKRGRTCAARITAYRCRACGKIFDHYYAKTPNFDKALQLAGIGECPSRKESDDQEAEV